MAAKSNLALEKERLGDALALRLGSPSNTSMLLVNGRLWEHKTEQNDQDGRASTEPEERAPAVRGRVDKTSGKGRRQEIAESVLGKLVLGIWHWEYFTHPLLQNTTHQSTGFFREIFEGGGSSVSVQTTHCHTEKSSACKELSIGVREPGTLSN